MEVCNSFQANKTMIGRQAANALEILEYFARRLKPATPAEIAEDLGWPRSSTFKLVGTLASQGYLYEQRARRGYYPSQRWLVLAETVASAEPLTDQYQRLPQDLTAETGQRDAVYAAAGTHEEFTEGGGIGGLR